MRVTPPGYPRCGVPTAAIAVGGVTRTDRRPHRGRAERGHDPAADPRAHRTVGARSSGPATTPQCSPLPTAASSRPSTPSCTAPTSASPGRARTTSAGRPPPSTSPTSRRWAPARPRCSWPSRCPTTPGCRSSRALADGLRAACDALAPGCAVEGGDLTVSDTLTIAVTALGVLDGRDAGAAQRAPARATSSPSPANSGRQHAGSAAVRAIPGCRGQPHRRSTATR